MLDSTKVIECRKKNKHIAQILREISRKPGTLKVTINDGYEVQSTFSDIRHNRHAFRKM